MMLLNVGMLMSARVQADERWMKQKGSIQDDAPSIKMDALWWRESKKEAKREMELQHVGFPCSPLP